MILPHKLGEGPGAHALGEGRVLLPHGVGGMVKQRGVWASIGHRHSLPTTLRDCAVHGKSGIALAPKSRLTSPLGFPTLLLLARE